jgi:hypothetical protein
LPFLQLLQFDGRLIHSTLVTPSAGPTQVHHPALLPQLARDCGLTVFRCEGIVSKRLGSRYRSGRSLDWLKFKNPAAPAVRREAEEDWGRAR